MKNVRQCCGSVGTIFNRTKEEKKEKMRDSGSVIIREQFNESHSLLKILFWAIKIIYIQ